VGLNKFFSNVCIIPPIKGGELRIVPSPLVGEVYPPLAAPKATRGKGEGVFSGQRINETQLQFGGTPFWL